METFSNPISSTLFGPILFLPLKILLVSFVAKNNVVLSFQTVSPSIQLHTLGVSVSRRRKHPFRYSDIHLLSSSAYCTNSICSLQQSEDGFHKDRRTCLTHGRLHQPKSLCSSSLSASSNDNDNDNDVPRSQKICLEIYEINDDANDSRSPGSFSASRFASTGCWGKRPLLWRGAFSSESSSLHRRQNRQRQDDSIDDDDCPWPTWNEVIEYATDETAEARLISHIPDDVTSWELDIGPFGFDDLDSVLSLPTPTSTWKNADPPKLNTLVVNDADRYHPPLSDWIFDTFSSPHKNFIPRWRLDDGQISLAHTGGGIGPHVDDYDVFLIQMAGRRVWGVETAGSVSVRDEMTEGGLVEGIDVRILQSWGHKDVDGVGTVREVVLEPGDVLYLPPRVGHCGSAVEDHSMTLSVGLRAPSTKDMMTRLVEEVGDIFQGKIAERYRDPDLLDTIDDRRDSSDGEVTGRGNTNEITQEVKARARALFKDAVIDLIDDECFFDSFFGRLATDSNRFRVDYPPPLYLPDNYDDENINNDDYDEGLKGEARRIVRKMLERKGTLYAAEGIAWAHSKVDGAISRLFVDGKMWELEPAREDDGKVSVQGAAERLRMQGMVEMIANNRELDGEMFIMNIKDGDDDEIIRNTPKKIVQLLEDLVQQGFLYGSEE